MFESLGFAVLVVASVAALIAGVLALVVWRALGGREMLWLGLVWLLIGVGLGWFLWEHSPYQVTHVAEWR